MLSYFWANPKKKKAQKKQKKILTIFFCFVIVIHILILDYSYIGIYDFFACQRDLKSIKKEYKDVQFPYSEIWVSYWREVK